MNPLSIAPGSMVTWSDPYGTAYLYTSIDDWPDGKSLFLSPKTSGPWLVVCVQSSDPTIHHPLDMLGVLTPDREFGWVYRGHVTATA